MSLGMACTMCCLSVCCMNKRGCTEALGKLQSEMLVVLLINNCECILSAVLYRAIEKTQAVSIH